VLCLFHMKSNSYEKKTDKELLVDEIFHAKSLWDLAVSQFNELTHPEAIEYMTYQIKAAEKKYIYLLNLYKQEYGQGYEDESDVIYKQKRMGERV